MARDDPAGQEGAVFFLFFFFQMDAPPDVPNAASAPTTSNSRLKAKQMKMSPSISSPTQVIAPDGPLKGFVFALAGGTVIPKTCFTVWSTFVKQQGGILFHAADAKLDVTDGGAVTHGKEGSTSIARTTRAPIYLLPPPSTRAICVRHVTLLVYFRRGYRIASQTPRIYF